MNAPSFLRSYLAIPRRQLARIALSSLGIGVALLFVSFMASQALIGAKAEEILLHQFEQKYVTMMRPAIPVFEIRAIQNRTNGLDYSLDALIEVSYFCNPAAQEPSAIGAKVFHVSDWQFDAYYVPAGATSDPASRYDAEIYYLFEKYPTPDDEINTLPGDIQTLFFVDTTYLRHVSFVVCAIACILGAFASWAFRIRGQVFAMERDSADAALESSFANASHELKTPLMAIRGYAEGMQAGAVTGEFALPRIIAASDRMADTVDGILKISRADSGLKQPVLGMWDVREIVYDEARMVEDACRERGITLDVRLPRPLVRPCDESMTATVVRNVLGNAVRHAESFVRVSEGRTLKGEIELVVQNDGQPPTPDELAHAFERFYKGTGGSTGIGLAVSREYVELMGGEIIMEVAGHTTRITVRL